MYKLSRVRPICQPPGQSGYIGLPITVCRGWFGREFKNHCLEVTKLLCRMNTSDKTTKIVFTMLTTLEQQQNTMMLANVGLRELSYKKDELGQSCQNMTLFWNIELVLQLLYNYYTGGRTNVLYIWLRNSDRNFVIK